tara:strand:+ start:48 stop:416 length:369 start_codon:yes stop_codon:yes gene_type:complete
MSSKIKAPILYPRDSEIKSRNLTEDQVLDYYNAQRGHQNNVEFSCTFIPLLLAAGLLPEITLSVAKAGALALGARFIGQFAYSQAPQFRQISGIWHIGEMYILYLVFSQTGLSFGWAMEGLM